MICCLWHAFSIKRAVATTLAFFSFGVRTRMLIDRLTSFRRWKVILSNGQPRRERRCSTLSRASRTHKNIKSVPGYFYCVLACICTTPALYLLLNSLVKHKSVKACCKSCGEHFVSTACTQVLGYDPDDENENDKAIELGLPQDLRGPIEHGTGLWRNQKERLDGSKRNRGGFKARLDEIWKITRGVLPPEVRWRFSINNKKTGANTQHAVHSSACVRSFSKSCGNHRDSFVRAL